MANGDDTQARDDSATREQPVANRAHVRVMVGNLAGSCHPLTRDGIVLGRAGEPVEDDVGMLVLDDPWISRRHAYLHARKGLWQITDLGGRNRSFVDGTPVPAGGDAELMDGSLLRLGDTLLLFRRSTPIEEEKWGHVGFPGYAPAASAVRNRLLQLSRTSGHVLVLGETGTGKERVARALAPPDRPFVPQNCAELTREFARSELFGHLRGSFSGAVAAKPGLVEVAEAGVLFLDEIGELSLDIQAELLRFLEDGYYRPIGATELRRSSARVVAATNVDLDTAVHTGRFRRDLLNRLRSSNPPLELPPLRARREDITGWAQLFLDEAAPTPPNAHSRAWHAGTVECLLLYPWPGNLRELRGTVRGLVAAGLDLSARPEQLPDGLRDHRRALRVTPGSATATEERTPPELTRESIEAALSAAAGSVRATANQFGIDRRKLYRICDRLGIDLDRYRATPEKEEESDG